MEQPIAKRKNKEKKQKSGGNLFGILKPYTGWVVFLVVITILANGLNLVIPKLISWGIDSYTSGTFQLRTTVIEFSLVALFIFIFGYIQSVVQTYVSERVAKDMRNTLAAKISRQTYTQLQTKIPSKLLTNLTSDMDSVKVFVSQAIVSLISSAFLIVGASVLLLLINWKLALAVLAILPFIAITFFMVFSKIRPLFRKTQEIIDSLNKTINESILGAALIRVLNAETEEYKKFMAINTTARDTGLQILKLFSIVIPIVSIIANLASLVILALGGHFVIAGTMTLGNFTAFNNYVLILIFPIIIIGFMGTVISRAQASYARVYEILSEKEIPDHGTIEKPLKGNIEVQNLTRMFGEKAVLKNVSFTVAPKTKTAIIGPTAAGKTQLLYTLFGLLPPESGSVKYDGELLERYKKNSFYSQVGIVFQDSILFNMSVRENISFSPEVKSEALEKAIQTAELKDFIDALPQGLDTIVSERGSSLSGGQKQRIMLARALALNPKILLLDDFTARVDTSTEQKILANLSKNYPELTLISVTQKIGSVEQFENIILLMEGEILAQGTHEKLMESSPEYVQIFDSQRSTNTYELHA